MILTVQRNGHVYLSKAKNTTAHHPPLLASRCMSLLPLPDTIVLSGNCIATHATDIPGKYVTVDEHMASHHRAVKDGMDEQVLKQRASSIGPPVLAVLEEVFKRSIHPEQAYKSCQGILSLAKKHLKKY